MHSAEDGDKNRTEVTATFRRGDSLHSPNRKETDQHTQNLQKIESTRGKLDELIGDLNGKLFSHFHRKQQQLLEQYKEELLTAQRELNQMKSTTNEQQIRKKMVERKKELEVQRHKLIRQNMDFSNNCEEYKKKLAEMVAHGQELEREIIFLDGQMKQATKRKFQLADQSVGKTEKAETERQPETTRKEERTKMLSNYEHSSKLGSSVSMRTHKMPVIANRQVILKRLNLNAGDDIIGISKPKQSKRDYRQVLEKTPLQSLFEQVVQGVKSRRKTKKTSPLGEEFSDFEKKTIMEQFLGHQDAKKAIYAIIFDFKEEQGGAMGFGVNEKPARTKIAYQDIS